MSKSFSANFVCVLVFVKFPNLHDLSRDGAVPRPALLHMLDIPTKLTLLYSPYSMSSCGLNSNPLVPLLVELAYLAMLFILQVIHNNSSVPNNR